MKNYEKLYKTKAKEYKKLYETLDATNLKPVQGALRKHQLSILNLVKMFVEIFDKENIQYFLCGGTLIGALRNGGFVPWDDDFDFAMMREDYEKVLAYCENKFIKIEPTEISFLKDDRSKIWKKYIKKYPNKIIYSQTPHHIQFLKGTSLKDVVSIDIFPYDFVNEETSFDEFLKYVEEFKKIKFKTIDNQKLLDICKSERENNKIFQKNGNKVYYGLDNINNYMMEQIDFFTYDMIFPLKKVKFEDMEISIQNKPDDFAKRQYADYKGMPRDIDISHHKKHNNILDKILLLTDNIIVKEYIMYLLCKPKMFKDAYFELIEKEKFIKSIKR